MLALEQTARRAAHGPRRALESSTCRPCRPTISRSIGEEQLDVRFACRRGDLAKLIDKTQFAISTEETRYYLNGVYMHAAKGGATAMLRGVATDGHRLARIEVALPEGPTACPA